MNYNPDADNCNKCDDKPVTVADVKLCIAEALQAAGFATSGDVKLCVGQAIQDNALQSLGDVQLLISNALGSLNLPSLTDVKLCIAQALEAAGFVTQTEVDLSVLTATEEFLNELEVKGILLDCLKEMDFVTALEAKQIILNCIAELGLQPAALDINEDGSATFVGQNSSGTDITKDLQCKNTYLQQETGTPPPMGNGTHQYVHDPITGHLLYEVYPDGSVITDPEDIYNQYDFNSVGVEYDEDNPPAAPTKGPNVQEGAYLQQCFENGTRIYRCVNGALVQAGFKYNTIATVQEGTGANAGTVIVEGPNGDGTGGRTSCAVSAAIPKKCDNTDYAKGDVYQPWTMSDGGIVVPGDTFKGPDSAILDAACLPPTPACPVNGMLTWSKNTLFAWRNGAWVAVMAGDCNFDATTKLASTQLNDADLAPLLGQGFVPIDTREVCIVNTDCWRHCVYLSYRWNFSGIMANGNHWDAMISLTNGGSSAHFSGIPVQSHDATMSVSGGTETFNGGPYIGVSPIPVFLNHGVTQCYEITLSIRVDDYVSHPNNKILPTAFALSANTRRDLKTLCA